MRLSYLLMAMAPFTAHGERLAKVVISEFGCYDDKVSSSGDPLNVVEGMCQSAVLQTKPVASEPRFKSVKWNNDTMTFFNDGTCTNVATTIGTSQSVCTLLGTSEFGAQVMEVKDVELDKLMWFEWWLLSTTCQGSSFAPLPNEAFLWECGTCYYVYALSSEYPVKGDTRVVCDGDSVAFEECDGGDYKVFPVGSCADGLRLDRAIFNRNWVYVKSSDYDPISPSIPPSDGTPPSISRRALAIGLGVAGFLILISVIAVIRDIRNKSSKKKTKALDDPANPTGGMVAAPLAVNPQPVALSPPTGGDFDHTQSFVVNENHQTPTGQTGYMGASFGGDVAPQVVALTASNGGVVAMPERIRTADEFPVVIAVKENK